MTKPTLYIVSAPSGAGKTSLTRTLAARNESVAISISHTTRDRRPGERDGVDYHFVNQGRFLEMVNENCFLEWAEVFGHFYGTASGSVTDLLNAGHHVLLDIDWQGARKVRAAVSGAVSVFVLPPNLAVLEERLRSRGRDSDDVIDRRMKAAVREIQHFMEYDHLIVNDNFDRALAELTDLVNDGIAPRSAKEFDLDTLLNASKPVNSRS